MGILTRYRRLAACVAASVVTFGVLVPANAEQADPAVVGGIVLFDASGTPVRSGDDLGTWAAYAAASEVVSDRGSPTILSAAVTDPTTAPTDWPVVQLATTDGSKPADPPATLAKLGYGVVPVGSADLAGLASDGKTDVQLRLSDAANGSGYYWATDVIVDTATGHWEQVDAVDRPAEVRLDDPAVSVGADGDVTISSSVAADASGTRPTGWMELFDGDTPRGVADYDPATGSVVATDAPTAGDHRYTLRFTPADSVRHAAATSAAATCTCGGAVRNITKTTTAVAATPNPGNRAFGSVAIGATVLPLGVAGTVNFTESGNLLASVPVADGTAGFETNSLGAGRHVVTATFVAADPQTAAGSTASSDPFTLVAADTATPPPGDSSHPTPAGGSAAATGSDAPARPKAGSTATTVPAASAQVEVPAGQLILTTPYTPGHPLRLGRLTLDDRGTKLVSTAHLGTVATASTTGITVTDTRAGDPGWSATLMAGDFANGTDRISAQNAGLVNVRAVPVPGAGGGYLGTAQRPVTVHDVLPSTVVRGVEEKGTAGLAGQPKIFASTTSGRGTVYIVGDLVLDAPVTALSGSYTSTLTFTVS